MLQALTVFFFLLITAASFSQNYYEQEKWEPLQGKQKTVYDSLPRAWFGTSTGLNNFSGLLGVGATGRIYKGWQVKVGLGLDSWGVKRTLGLVYELNPRSGWCFGISYSNSSGGEKMKLNLETLDSANKKVKKEVLLDMFMAHNLNFTATYNIRFGGNKMIFVETGYSASLNPRAYLLLDGSRLSPEAKFQLENQQQPGGPVVGVGFMIGF